MICQWMECKLSFGSVLPIWRKMVETGAFEPLNNLRYEQDRVFYARYVFTGIIFGKAYEAVYGNSTLFSIPDTVKNYKRDTQNFFFGLNLQNFEYKTSLEHSVSSKMVSGLVALADRIQRKTIICSFLVRTLNVDSKLTLADIKMQDPSVVDWSNVPDYLTREHFFSMARACSATRTVHKLHLMNWQGAVFGASLIDHADKLKTYRALIKEMNCKYNDVKHTRPYLRQDCYRVFFMNATDKLLCTKFCKNYIKYFFKGRAVDYVVTQPDLFNPFEKSNGCFFLSFTFKSIGV